jgi:hypothetical protein
VDVFDFCAPPGAVQQLRRYFTNPGFVLAPVMTCDPGPGQPIDMVVQIEHVYGDTTPQFWGHSGEPGGGPREIVHVEHAAWPGTVTSFGDARIGTLARVLGTRLADCTIDAASVTLPPSSTPEPSVTLDSSSPTSETPIATPASPPFGTTPGGIIGKQVQLPSTGHPTAEGSERRTRLEILAVALAVCVGAAAAFRVGRRPG